MAILSISCGDIINIVWRYLAKLQKSLENRINKGFAKKLPKKRSFLSIRSALRSKGTLLILPRFAQSVTALATLALDLLAYGCSRIRADGKYQEISNHSRRQQHDTTPKTLRSAIDSHHLLRGSGARRNSPPLLASSHSPLHLPPLESICLSGYYVDSNSAGREARSGG